MIMRAWVAGATGFTGREVVRQLAEQGHEVMAHVRPDSSRLEEWRARFGQLGASVDATPWEPEAQAERLRAYQPQLVFALLGTTRARARRDGVSTYEHVDYGLTMMLLRAAQAAAQAGTAPRFVYLSAAGAGPKVVGEYMRVRWRCEEAVRHSGLPYLIARPSFIVGPNRDEPRMGERVGAGVIDAALAVAGTLGARRLRERYRSTSDHQLARALVARAVAEPQGREVAESETLRSAP